MLGGLGITDLKLAGFALQSRWLWLQKTDNSRAWSELPIKTDPEVQTFFRASTYTDIGDGMNALFWDDRWILGAAASDIAPNLVCMVSRRTRARHTVREGLMDRRWTSSISGNMTTVTLAEYLDLWEATTHIILTDRPNQTVWRWTPDGKYSAKSAYVILHTERS
jgi:hypothetical protein